MLSYILINRQSTGSWTFSGGRIWFSILKASLIQLFLGKAHRGDVFILLASLCLSSFQASLLFSLLSVLKGLCSVAQICLRRPGISPPSVFSLFPIRLLSLSQNSLLCLCLCLTFSIPPLQTLPRDRKGGHLIYSTLFLPPPWNRLDPNPIQSRGHWKDKVIIFSLKKRKYHPMSTVQPSWSVCKRKKFICHPLNYKVCGANSLIKSTWQTHSCLHGDAIQFIYH